jgi:hypothetical protein
MKIANIIILVFLFFGISSCDSSKSLQEYIVEKQQDNGFISLDIPASILNLKDENASEESLKAIKSIKKFNFLGMQLNDKNKESYIAEKEAVKDILSNKKFKEIFRVKTGNSEVSVKYLGEENNIDEVVFFGADNEKGLAILRVLGDNMNPAEMVQLLNKINIDKESNEFKSLSSIFEKVK